MLRLRKKTPMAYFCMRGRRVSCVKSHKSSGAARKITIFSLSYKDL